MKQSLRIIGGKWRSRKIAFPDVTGLRPSTDRVRETVFNWLTTYLQGAVCLDLFAGSGALGFESLSRGAKLAVMIDKSPKVIAQLKETAKLLNASNAEIILLKIPEEINLLPNYKYDIIFLDPPFKQNLIKPCCEWIEFSSQSKENTLIYIEAEAELNITEIIPKSWQILHNKKTKQVGYHLCCKK